MQISIHPPRAGRDLPSNSELMRAAIYFNPPAPCGAGRTTTLLCGLPIYFNPPAPCGAGQYILQPAQVNVKFQSTRPVRGGTEERIRLETLLGISIHPPRAGRAPSASAPRPRPPNFNPPAPCGAGLQDKYVKGNPDYISIHPPHAGRDYARFCLKSHLSAISIHPPHAGRDPQNLPIDHLLEDFNPPAPCGAGRCHCPDILAGCRFQSTRPMRGGTTLFP